MEVFFPRDAANHPGGTSTDPNWFYYWKDGGVCGIDSKCVFDVGTPQHPINYGQTNPGVDDIMRLGRSAPTYNYGPQTFTRSDGQMVIGTGNGHGIQCVAETIRHERHHLEIYNAFGLLITQTGPNETDGDAIPDASEPTYDGVETYFNNADTFNVASVEQVPDYALYGDNELRCLMSELQLNIPLHPELDWANPGCQSKNQSGPLP